MCVGYVLIGNNEMWLYSRKLFAGVAETRATE